MSEKWFFPLWSYSASKMIIFPKLSAFPLKETANFSQIHFFDAGGPSSTQVVDQNKQQTCHRQHYFILIVHSTNNQKKVKRKSIFIFKQSEYINNYISVIWSATSHSNSCVFEGDLGERKKERKKGKNTFFIPQVIWIYLTKMNDKTKEETRKERKRNSRGWK